MIKNEVIYYCIGDMVFKVISDFEHPLPDQNAVDFRISECQEDHVIRFINTSDISELTGQARIVDQNLLGFDMIDVHGKHIRGFNWKNQICDAILKFGEREGNVFYISAGVMAERCRSGFNFVNYFGLEHVFLERGGFFLHSSHLNVNGKALLFSAPSGTGKSTQAELWAKHAGAEIINGDRSLLRKKDGVWHAYGCPMCGTSGIHKQGNEPIHAIVMLSQGTENTVRRLSAGEAFQRMYPEITVPKWNRELVLRAMELLDDVMASVPIYAFSCTKDENAVRALREALQL